METRTNGYLDFLELDNLSAVLIEKINHNVAIMCWLLLALKDFYAVRVTPGNVSRVISFVNLLLYKLLYFI